MTIQEAVIELEKAVDDAVEVNAALRSRVASSDEVTVQMAADNVALHSRVGELERQKIFFEAECAVKSSRVKELVDELNANEKRRLELAIRMDNLESILRKKDDAMGKAGDLFFEGRESEGIECLEKALALAPADVKPGRTIIGVDLAGPGKDVHVAYVTMLAPEFEKLQGRCAELEAKLKEAEGALKMWDGQAGGIIMEVLRPTEDGEFMPGLQITVREIVAGELARLRGEKGA